MSLKIRLRRMGRKKAPHYRIVVAESSMPRDGRFVANVGHYNPTTNPTTLVVNRDLALAWLAKGATPTETVQSLFKQAGVYREPSVVEGAAAAVTGAAAAAAGAVKAAASTVAETATAAASAVAETVRDAAEAVTERVAGDES
ncbi:MAG TPA: 30S ribosomal protein S16, partial [Longimicrobiaceae bacterium]|nr:30S ribosomal protein S16 [Longimicrobiaceae bacterium]